MGGYKLQISGPTVYSHTACDIIVLRFKNMRMLLRSMSEPAIRICRKIANIENFEWKTTFQ